MDMPYSAVLLRVRKQLNMTQEQLAHELSVSFSTVNRWEKGHTVPSRLARERITAFCIENNIDSEITKLLKR